MRLQDYPGLAVIGLCFFLATNVGTAAPETIDLGGIGDDDADSEDVIIPIPQEIFNSLDKLTATDWKKQSYQPEFKLGPSRSRTALIFGLRISEGFISVQAKDANAVMDIGREIIRLAGALGVESAVDRHASAIITEANRSNWPAVRTELDKTRKTVIDTMVELRDEALADLVTVGGWLGGTRALSSALETSYSKEGSDLLNQPLLLTEISKKYRNIPQSDKRGPVFGKVSDSLEALGPLMQTNEEGLIKIESVKQIHELTHKLSDAIYQGK